MAQKSLCTLSDKINTLGPTIINDGMEALA